MDALQHLLNLSHARFSKQWYLLAANVRRAPPLISCCIHMQQLPFTTCTEPHPLICCCRSSTPAVCQGIFACSRRIACTKPLPPIQVMLLCLQAYGSHTYRSIEISICLSWVYIARYLQSVVSTISERVLQLTNPGLTQIAIRVSSCNLVSMMIVITVKQELIIEHTRGIQFQYSCGTICKWDQNFDCQKVSLVHLIWH